MDSDDEDPPPPPVPPLCLHCMHTDPQLIVAISPGRFAIYRSPPLTYVSSGTIELEPQLDGDSQLVVRGEGDALPDAVQQELVECWAAHHMRDRWNTFH